MGKSLTAGTFVGAQEPELAVSEIQGNVLPGFHTRYLTLVFLEVLDNEQAARWLRRLRITTLADVLWAREGRGRPSVGVSPPWTNVALSFPGLCKLSRQAERLTDVAFKQGMHRRSALLADPADADAEGYCANWLIGGPGDGGRDVLLILGADEPDPVDATVVELRDRPPPGLRTAFVQPGAMLSPPSTGHEPFGFCDGISQPGVRGRISDDPDDLLTLGPGARRGGLERNLVWPGEFVFGYPGQDALDRLRAGPTVEGGPPWTRNGSMLVFRRLRQDVDAFHRFVRTTADELAQRHPALAGLTPEKLSAKLMGRWPSGAPLMQTPDTDCPELSGQNDFTFVADGDAGGLNCPHAAHIRRAYLRDAATSGLTDANIETHRLVRRSIPFGDETTCGLLFLAYQTSIERQFEFITRAWLNNPHLHETDDGHDPIAGQSFGMRGNRTRVFALKVASADGSVERISLTLPHDWVVPTGGGYFFAPAVSAVRRLTG